MDQYDPDLKTSVGTQSKRDHLFSGRKEVQLRGSIAWVPATAIRGPG
jgi:hypothetical protein